MVLLVKRMMDVAGSLTGLVVLSPVWLAVAIAVLIRMGHPVLLRQKRPGFHSESFVLLKFRTMTDARDVSGQPLPDSERMTPLGRFLRSTSLDELPELLNVLRGEMSLVGPRPLLMEYIDLYTSEQLRRHEVRPGITGWAQINGRNALSWEQKFAYDVWYVDHLNLWLDIRIIIMTMWKIVRREGISYPGEATMQKFKGTSIPPEAQQ